MSHEIILRQMYAAFNARDVDAVLALMHPEVKWPNGWEGGWVHGRSGVRAYWLRQWRHINSHVEPQKIQIKEDGRIAVDVHQVVRNLEGDLLVDTMVQHIYSMSDGLVTAMEIKES
jgi:ketosteroid isomerase-like protein